MEFLQRIRKSEKTVYCLAAIAGALVFFMVYGVRVLNPTYTDWLLSFGGDLSQHYLGWVGFRNSEWMFPLGMMDTLSYPHPTSIIFTDSIPLFAMVFKLISFALPETFQYFGLWGILCFMLQAMLTVRILKRYNDNPCFLFFSAMLLTVSPVLIQRMFAHTALAAHWLILLALEPIFNYESYRNAPKRLYIRTALLGFLAPSIHIYYVLISGMILAGFCLFDLLHREKVLRSATILGIYLVCAVSVTALLGGFSTSASAETHGLGVYSFNLNSFFNPAGNSDVLQDLPLCSSFQWEGYAYLGAGCLLASFVALFLLAGHTFLRFHWKLCTVLLTLILISLVCALSPVITLNDRVLLELRLPALLIKFWSIFRSTGRLGWIAVYIIVLSSLAIIGKLARFRQALLLVVICLSLQTYDLHSWIGNLHARFSGPTVWDPGLDDEIWSDLAADDSLEHVVLSSLSPSHYDMYVFADWATQHGKTLNTFYFARTDFDRAHTSLRTSLSQLSPENIYIFFEDDLYNCASLGLYCYSVDGYTVGTVQPLEGQEDLLIENTPVTWRYSPNQYLSEGGGHDEEQHRILYPWGYSYGPYVPLFAGKWEILVDGEGLDRANIQVYSQYGETHHPFQMTVAPKQLRIELTLSEAVEMLEIFIQNNSDRNIQINHLQFMPILD